MNSLLNLFNFKSLSHSFSKYYFFFFEKSGFNLEFSLQVSQTEASRRHLFVIENPQTKKLRSKNKLFRVRNEKIRFYFPKMATKINLTQPKNA